MWSQPAQVLYATLQRASRGHNGPVADTLFHGALSSSGSVALSDVDRKNLMDGELYLNFGTRRLPQGEVRAQLAPPR